ELIAALKPGGTAVLPAGEALLDPHRREDVETVTFGPGGDVAELPAGLSLPFTSAHMRMNALAALAAARAVGVEPEGEVNVALSNLRGRRVAVLGDMLELGPGERAFHEEIGRVATDTGVGLLVTVGPLAEQIGAAY